MKESDYINFSNYYLIKQGHKLSIKLPLHIHITLKYNHHTSLTFLFLAIFFDKISKICTKYGSRWRRIQRIP